MNATKKVLHLKDTEGLLQLTRYSRLNLYDSTTITKFLPCNIKMSTTKIQQ